MNLPSLQGESHLAKWQDKSILNLITCLVPEKLCESNILVSANWCWECVKKRWNLAEFQFSRVKICVKRHPDTVSYITDKTLSLQQPCKIRSLTARGWCPEFAAVFVALWMPQPVSPSEVQMNSGQACFLLQSLTTGPFPPLTANEFSCLRNVKNNIKMFYVWQWNWQFKG